MKCASSAIVRLSLALVLGACAMNPSAPVAIAVPSGQATLSLSRPSAFYGAGTSVDIDLNGNKIASIPNGGSYSGPIPPGSATLTATCWSSPGRYRIAFTAQPGKTYAFEIRPRGTQIAAVAFGGMIGLGVDTATNGDQSGAFEIIPVLQ